MFSFKVWKVQKLKKTIIQPFIDGLSHNLTTQRKRCKHFGAFPSRWPSLLVCFSFCFLFFKCNLFTNLCYNSLVSVPSVPRTKLWALHRMSHSVLPIPLWGGVLVASGGCNKNITDWTAIINNRSLFLQVLEAEKSKTEVPADSVSGSDVLPGP